MTTEHSFLPVEDWFRQRARPVLERWLPDRVQTVEALLAEVRRLSGVRTRELPICLLGNAGVGKSTLINALVDPVVPVLPQGGVGPLTAQATVVRFADTPYLKAEYHGGQRLNNLLFGLDPRRRGATADGASEADSRQTLELELGQPDDGGDTTAEERAGAESLVSSYLRQARLMVTGDQWGSGSDDDRPYLVQALRQALARQSASSPDVRPEHRAHLARLERCLAESELLIPGDDPRFRDELKLHASGSISPLIRTLEVGWPAEVLREGPVLVDLPGVGIANDEYRSVTTRQIREASAVLLVVDRSGVTEASAELLRHVGFFNALLHRAPGSHDVSPLLWVAMVKLDLVATDERGEARQGDGKPRPWLDYFRGACERGRMMVRQQIDRELSALVESGGAESRDARQSSLRHVVEKLQVFPVSAIEYRKYHQDDEDERPHIRDDADSNIPALAAAFRELAARYRTEVDRRQRATLAEARQLIESGLDLVAAEIDDDARRQVALEEARRDLEQKVTALRRQLHARQGAFRESIRETIPARIGQAVAKATADGGRAARGYLKKLERYNWSTLRAAVRRGGTFVGAKLVDLPGELSLQYEEPLAVVWSHSILAELQGALRSIATAYSDLVTELADWAGQRLSAQESLRVRAIRDDIEAWTRTLDHLAENAVEKLRDEAKRHLYEAIEGQVRESCQTFVIARRDLGKGVKGRIFELLSEMVDDATRKASDAAGGFLTARYHAVVREISGVVEKLPDPVGSASELLLKAQAEVDADERAKRRALAGDIASIRGELAAVTEGGAP